MFTRSSLSKPPASLVRQPNHHVVHQSNTEQDLTEQDKSLKLEKEREELFLKASKDGRAKSKHPKQQLGLEMDLWNWMRQACLRAGKKWTLLDPGKRGRRNMGPTQSMMEQMRQDEKSEIWGPTNYRGYFLDFLASQESERGGTWYPFQYFMHEYMDKVTSELPHENRLADLMKKRQDLSPWPGAGPGRPREDVESILDAGTAVKRREEVDEALLEINRVGPQRATSGGFIDPATIIVPGKGIQSDDPEVFGSEQ